MIVIIVVWTPSEMWISLDNFLRLVEIPTAATAAPHECFLRLTVVFPLMDHGLEVRYFNGDGRMLQNEGDPVVLYGGIIFSDFEAADYTCRLLDTSLIPHHLLRLIAMWLRTEREPVWRLVKDETQLPVQRAKEVSSHVTRAAVKGDSPISAAVIRGRKPPRAGDTPRGARRIVLRLGMTEFVSRIDRAGSRRLVTLAATYEFLHHQFTFLSVLGGAYSALGRSSTKHVRTRCSSRWGLSVRLSELALLMFL